VKKGACVRFQNQVSDVEETTISIIRNHQSSSDHPKNFNNLSSVVQYSTVVGTRRTSNK
jgi:hypothetical protein